MLLSGRPPYKGENQLATLQLVMSGARNRRRCSDRCRAVIRAIVAKALMHDPAHRFQSARELGMALEDAMNRLGLGTTGDAGRAAAAGADWRSPPGAS